MCTAIGVVVAVEIELGSVAEEGARDDGVIVTGDWNVSVINGVVYT